MLKVALIGLSSLENIAFREICSNYPILEIEVFASFPNFHTFAERFSAYIVSSEIFLLQSDYFLPRKTQTIIVFSDSRLHNSSGRFNIFPQTDQSEIESMINELTKLSKEEHEITAELSARERDVLKEVARGLTNKEIAEKLTISVNTVITHRKNLSGKLGIKSASGLSLYALMNGII